MESVNKYRIPINLPHGSSVEKTYYLSDDVYRKITRAPEGELRKVLYEITHDDIFEGVYDEGLKRVKSSLISERRRILKSLESDMIKFGR